MFGLAESVYPPRDIRIADRPEDFAAHAIELLENPEERLRVADAAWEMVNAQFSWEHVSRCFERIILTVPRL